jgi:serine/threonine protein kinase
MKKNKISFISIILCLLIVSTPFAYAANCEVVQAVKSNHPVAAPIVNQINIEQVFLNLKTRLTQPEGLGLTETEAVAIIKLEFPEYVSSEEGLTNNILAARAADEEQILAALETASLPAGTSVATPAPQEIPTMDVATIVNPNNVAATFNGIEIKGISFESTKILGKGVSGQIYPLTSLGKDEQTKQDNAHAFLVMMIVSKVLRDPTKYGKPTTVTFVDLANEYKQLENKQLEEIINEGVPLANQVTAEGILKAKIVVKIIPNMFTSKFIIPKESAAVGFNSPGLTTMYYAGMIDETYGIVVEEQVEGISLEDLRKVQQPPVGFDTLTEGQKNSVVKRMSEDKRRLEEQYPGITAIDFKNPEVALALLNQVTAGLKALGIDILHTDIKPANIMVMLDKSTGKPIFKVIDYGSILFKNKDLYTKFDVDYEEYVSGTPAYMAPEMADEQKKIIPAAGEEARVDKRADQFSLGASLFDLITGKRFMKILLADFVPAPNSKTQIVKAIGEVGTNPEKRAAAQKRIDEAIEAPENNVPEALKPILKKMLQIDRTQRYASDDELIAALQEAEGKAIAQPAPVVAPTPAAQPTAQPALATAEGVKGRFFQRLWGSQFEGAGEIIEVNDIGQELKTKVRNAYQETFGKLSANPTEAEIASASELFSIEVRSILPFLTYPGPNYEIANIPSEERLQKMREYLALFNQGAVKLSELVKLGMLDCTGQNLVIQQSLQEQGFVLYHASYESKDGQLVLPYESKGGKITSRTHTILAKQITINGKKFALIIDPLEGPVWEPKAKANGKNYYLQPWEDFEKKNLNPEIVRAPTLSPVPQPEISVQDSNSEVVSTGQVSELEETVRIAARSQAAVALVDSSRGVLGAAKVAETAVIVSQELRDEAAAIAKSIAAGRNRDIVRLESQIKALEELSTSLGEAKAKYLQHSKDLINNLIDAIKSQNEETIASAIKDLEKQKGYLQDLIVETITHERSHLLVELMPNVEIDSILKDPATVEAVRIFKEDNKEEPAYQQGSLSEQDYNRMILKEILVRHIAAKQVEILQRNAGRFTENSHYTGYNKNIERALSNLIKNIISPSDALKLIVESSSLASFYQRLAEFMKLPKIEWASQSKLIAAISQEGAVAEVIAAQAQPAAQPTPAEAAAKAAQQAEGTETLAKTIEIEGLAEAIKKTATKVDPKVVEGIVAAEATAQLGTEVFPESTQPAVEPPAIDEITAADEASTESQAAVEIPSAIGVNAQTTVEEIDPRTREFLKVVRGGEIFTDDVTSLLIDYLGEWVPANQELKWNKDKEEVDTLVNLKVEQGKTPYEYPVLLEGDVYDIPASGETTKQALKAEGDKIKKAAGIQEVPDPLDRGRKLIVKLKTYPNGNRLAYLPIEITVLKLPGEREKYYWGYLTINEIRQKLTKEQAITISDSDLMSYVDYGSALQFKGTGMYSYERHYSDKEYVTHTDFIERLKQSLQGTPATMYPEEFAFIGEINNHAFERAGQILDRGENTDILTFIESTMKYSAEISKIFNYNGAQYTVTRSQREINKVKTDVYIITSSKIKEEMVIPIVIPLGTLEKDAARDLAQTALSHILGLDILDTIVKNSEINEYRARYSAGNLWDKDGKVSPAWIIQFKLAMPEIPGQPIMYYYSYKIAKKEVLTELVGSPVVLPHLTYQPSASEGIGMAFAVGEKDVINIQQKLKDNGAKLNVWSIGVLDTGMSVENELYVQVWRARTGGRMRLEPVDNYIEFNRLLNTQKSDSERASLEKMIIISKENIKKLSLEAGGNFNVLFANIGTNTRAFLDSHVGSSSRLMRIGKDFDVFGKIADLGEYQEWPGQNEQGYDPQTEKEYGTNLIYQWLRFIGNYLAS